MNTRCPATIRLPAARALALAALLSAAATSLPAGRVRAATYTWTGGAGSNTAWSNPINWSNFLPPPSNLAITDVVFGISASTIPTLDQPYSVHALSFGGGATPYIFVGSDLTLGAGGLTQNTPNAQTFSVAVLLGADQSWTLANGTGALSFNGGLNTAGYTLTVSAATTTGKGNVVNGAITGGGSLATTGAGTLTLTGANTFTGGTTFAGGVLNAGSAGALGNQGTLSFSGGTLQFSAANTTDYSARFSTAAGQAFSVDTNGQDVTFRSGLQSSGGSLTKLGAGTLTLAAASAFTGGTTVNAGTLAVTNSVAGGSVTVGAGATLALSGNGRINSPGSTTLTVDGTTDSPAAVTLAGSASFSTSLAIVGFRGDGSVTQSGGSFTVVNGGALYLGTSRIGDNNRGGDGTYTLSGTGTLTTGQTFVSNGNNVSVFTQSGNSTHTTNELVLGAGNPAAKGTYNLNGGTLSVGDITKDGGIGIFNFNGGTLQARGSNANLMQYLSTVNVQAGGARIDTNGYDVKVNHQLVHDTTTGAPATDGGLIKQGAGTLTLLGNSTYTGPTTVSTGTLVLTGVQTSTSAVTVNPGATLKGGGSFPGAVTVQTGGTLVPGATGPNRLFVGGALNLNSGSNLSVELGGTSPGLGYDQILVTGRLTLGGSNLNVSLVNGFTLAVNQTFDIVLVDANSAPVSGVFANAVGGTLYTDARGDTFLISYTANVDNGVVPNDVRLTVVGVVPEPATWTLLLGGGVAGSLGLAVRRRRGLVA